MLTPEKISEWLKEVEERPESAALILKYVTDRLFELSSRNEELLSDNIALQSGQRVEEYEKHIAHLEYQLELLKRKIGGRELPELDEHTEAETPGVLNLLAYQARGRILRLELPVEMLAGKTTQQTIGRIADEMYIEGEPTRLLGVPAQEELLLFFTSGRVSPMPVSNIPVVETGVSWLWVQSALPDEARAGERLGCLMPLVGLPLSEYFIQVSRRGCVKKTMTSMAETILTKRFIGKGFIEKADQPFEIMLAHKGDRLVMVSWEGHILKLDVDGLSYAVEERIRLNAIDHVVSAFTVKRGASLLAITQTGKILHREIESLELAKSPLAKGQALISSSRLEQGARVIGAAAVYESDWCLALHEAGELTIHTVNDLITAGSLHTGSGLIAFTIYPNTEIDNP